MSLFSELQFFLQKSKKFQKKNSKQFLWIVPIKKYVLAKKNEEGEVYNFAFSKNPYWNDLSYCRSISTEQETQYRL